MIKTMELINFKCFSHAELELRNLTILSGANATGKSSVIQALILANHTNWQGENRGGKWDLVPIDINSIFGFSIGAPNALRSQDPVDEGDFAFAVSLQDEEGKVEYCYDIDMKFPLILRARGNKIRPIQSFQYVNAERVGPRVSTRAGNGEGISSDGENASYLIQVADESSREIAGDLKMGIGESHKFSYFVEQWMSAILGDVQLDIKTDYNKAITELLIKNKLVDHGVVPTLTGFGISYVLPIVVAGLWASGEKNAILILENPEAHLHPYAQSNMGKFLALLAVSGVQVIIETHSEHIIDGARYQMAYLNASDNMCVNFMEHEGRTINIKTISVNKYGELSIWPKGFFDQKQMDLREIMMLRRKDVCNQ